MTIGQTGIGYFYIVFMGTFGTNQLGFGGTEVLVGLIAAQLTNAVLIPLFGSLSDRVGRQPVIIFGFLYSAVFAWAGMAMLSGMDTPPLMFWLVMAMGNGIGVAAIFGPMAHTSSNCSAPSTPTPDSAWAVRVEMPSARRSSPSSPWRSRSTTPPCGSVS